jgi:hypothetical protein
VLGIEALQHVVKSVPLKLACNRTSHTGGKPRRPALTREAFRAAERSRRASALAELADLQNELGLTE